MRIQNYLKASPVFAINSAYEDVVVQMNRILREEKVNLLQGLVLTALFFEESDLVTPSKLAEVFETSRGNMSHAISHLEANGLCKRTIDQTDARRLLVTLKPFGKKKAQRLVKIFDDLQTRLEKKLGARETEGIARSLTKLREAFNS